MSDDLDRSGAGPVCSQPLCPLNRVRAGTAVRVKELCASPEMACRLREIGICEEQIVKLLAGHSNIICKVCNARMAISTPLAETIMVELLDPAEAST
jgi:Fe2+ transport system protein FeoA